MSVGDTFHYYGYTSDNGNQYTIKLADLIASAGLFSPVADPLVAAGPWPWHSRDMRHVNALNAITGKRITIPVSQASDGIFTGGGTVTVRGIDYQILGCEGERRPASHLR